MDDPFPFNILPGLFLYLSLFACFLFCFDVVAFVPLQCIVRFTFCRDWEMNQWVVFVSIFVFFVFCLFVASVALEGLPLVRTGRWTSGWSGERLPRASCYGIYCQAYEKFLSLYQLFCISYILKFHLSYTYIFTIFFIFKSQVYAKVFYHERLEYTIPPPTTISTTTTPQNENSGLPHYPQANTLSTG